MGRMNERKFSGHVCTSICPNLCVLLVFHWWSLPGSQWEAETISHCYSLWRQHKKQQSEKNKVESLQGPWQICSICWVSSFDVWHKLKKGKGIVDGCPFLSLYIIIQSLWFNESDHMGERFCLLGQLMVLCRMDWGHLRQNRAPDALIQSVKKQ